MTTAKVPHPRRFNDRNWCLATCGCAVYLIDGIYYAVDSFKGEPINVVATDTDVMTLIATLRELPTD